MAEKTTSVGCSMAFRDVLRGIAKLTGQKIYAVCDDLIPELNQRLKALQQKKGHHTHGR